MQLLLVSTCFNVSISLALLAPLCRSGPFSRSVSTVEDDYSRATLGKQSGKGFQAVGSRSEDWLQVPADCFFHFAMRVRTRTKKRTGKEHDMRYFCFWPWWYEIPLLLKKRWMNQHMLPSTVSSWVICTPGIWYHLWGRRKNGVFRKALLGVRLQRWERVGHFLQFYLAKKKWRSTYIGNSRASGDTVLLPLSTNILIPQIRLFGIVTTLRSLKTPLR